MNPTRGGNEGISQATMFEEMVGASASFTRLLTDLAKVAPTDSTVLITGESGTGKESLARAIHARSPRAANSFVTVNCAAIPPAPMAAEFIGVKFTLARDGTLYLDEVGDLSPDSQLTLLRMLEERQLEQVSGSLALPADVRIIAASNRDLGAAVDGGAFRADLFYQLNVFPLHIRPLRERTEDIPHLLRYFCDRYSAMARKSFKRISARTEQLFLRYPWPGNIPELRNVVERGVILCESSVFAIDESWLQRGRTRRTAARGVRRAAFPDNDEIEPLSRQQERVLALVAEGKTNKQIALEMKISPKTVQNYLSTVFEKFQVRRRSGAVARMLRNG